MGLDMYLEGRRYFSRNDYNFSDWSQKPTISEAYSEIMEAADLVGMDAEDGIGVEVRFTVGYWRKANQIHDWFVQNVQDGVDECQEAWVSREQLQELVDICKTVLADLSKAEELLPTRSGFFFGGTDYDDWYKGDLEFTAERLEKILADPAFAKCDFYYQSSW